MHHILKSCMLFIFLFAQNTLYASKQKDIIKCVSSSPITATLTWLSEYQNSSHALPEHLVLQTNQTHLIGTAIYQQVTSVRNTHDDTSLVTMRSGLSVHNDGSTSSTYCCLSFFKHATPELLANTPMEPLLKVLRHHQQQMEKAQRLNKTYKLYIVPEILSDYLEHDTGYPFLRGYFTVEKDDQETLQCVYRMLEGHDILQINSSSSDSDTESTHSEDHGVTDNSHDSSHDSIPPSSKRTPSNGNQKDLL